jgi:elongation factor G
MTDKIRNVCLLGHGSAGKTSLAESILFLTGSTDRLGKVAEGNTVCDYDAEEIKRAISISTATAFTEYKGVKINILDTPGYFDFAGEVKQAIRVSDAGIIVCPAKGGVSVGVEKSWDYLEEKKLPKLFYISKLDEDNGSFDETYNALREKFGHTVCPVAVPIIENEKVTGVVDVMLRKAYKMEKGKRVEVDIPAFMTDTLDEMHTVLAEAVAETSEELMEKYFAGEPFTEEELFAGLKSGVKDASIVPVLCGSAFTGIGTEVLLNAIVNLLPSPADAHHEIASAGDETAEIAADENGPVCLLVFKTLSDQYGKFSFFKVVRGKLDADMTLTNSRTGGSEKMGHIYNMMGKKNIEVKSISCGDIGAVSKLNETKTGDTLCDPKNVVTLEGIEFPEPCYSMAISPKVKGQEDKIANGLVRLGEEDLTFTVENNAETHQMVLSGAGDIHLDVLCSKLKSKFGVEVELSDVKVPYREKIRKKVKVQGRHKKQSGGRGQFGDCWIEMEGGQRGSGYVFEDAIVGGVIPRQYIPAIDKGIQESAARGYLAGCPVVDFKVKVYDGSYHPVDSSEMAFKMAGSIAFKNAMAQLKVQLLEPIVQMTVTIPDEFMGDVIGDLSSRRGKVLGSDSQDGLTELKVNVPMSEVLRYAPDLRSMTGGQGVFTMEFDHYEEAPQPVVDKVVAEHQAAKAAE